MDALLTEQEAADIFRLKVTTLQQWRFRGIGPRYVKVSERTIRYRMEDLEEYFEKKIVSPGGPASGANTAG